MFNSSVAFVVINGIVLAVAVRLWFRTRHIGFAWFSAAYGLTMASPFMLGFLYSMLRQSGPTSFSFVWLLTIPTSIGILIILGLRSFALSIGPPPPATSPTGDQAEARPPIQWSEVKRHGFGGVGVGMILGGILTIIRGISFMLSPSGEVADLGAGPGAIVVGAICIALAYHPRSPLRISEGDE